MESLFQTDPVSIIRKNMARFDKITGPFSKDIVLAGAGDVGRNTVTGLRKLGIEPLAFTDNNSNLWGTQRDGLPVMSPYDAARRYGGKAVFVVTIYNCSGLVRQLKSLNCIRVVPFAHLYWKYPETFMPHCCLDLPQAIYEQSDKIRMMLPLWRDDASRVEYLAQIRWRLFFDSENMPPSCPLSELYFPLDLISFVENEVYIDCGAFDGANIGSFIEQTDSRFKKIIAFEPDPGSYKMLGDYISTLPFEMRSKIVTVQSTIGKSKGVVNFDSQGAVASCVIESGGIIVGRVSLDDILQKESPTYIKMDIEGAEMDALIGAKELIRDASAVWAICLYHKQTDLWQIPLFMRSVSDHYDLYLRRHAEDCWELVLYAIPKYRLKKCM
jgi:FkbM family methyltransferase